jgi:hypothetical protein
MVILHTYKCLIWNISSYFSAYFVTVNLLYQSYWVGVGDEPWDKLKEFHDKLTIYTVPNRAFDNFQVDNEY